MSVAWTTIFIIAFLLPGILYHVGLYSQDRIPREIIRTGVVGEVAAAVFVSIAVHLFGWMLLRWFGVSANDFVGPIAELVAEQPERWAAGFDRIAVAFGAYVLATGAAGFLAGYFMAWTGVLATHKWAAELKTSRDTLVTAYVMTKMVVDDKVVMYRGGLTEFYLKADGSISYIVLNDCQRFYMSPQGDSLRIGRQLSLFGNPEEQTSRSWSCFTIDGANISNILFEKSPPISDTKDGKEALLHALDELGKALAGPSASNSFGL